MTSFPPLDRSLRHRFCQVDVPTRTIARLLEQACETRYDPCYQEAIRSISDALMYGTASGAPTGNPRTPLLDARQMDVLLRVRSFVGAAPAWAIKTSGGAIGF